MPVNSHWFNLPIGGIELENKVFVGGLSWSSTEESVKAVFEKLGEVFEVRIVMDRETGKSRGFGFVTYVDPSCVERAIEEFDGTELDGRRVGVNKAK